MPKRLQLAGRKFGRLSVLSAAGSNGRRSLWNCVCDCGTAKVVQGNLLVGGNTTSCGCYLKEIQHQYSPASKVDLAGKLFGRLVVLGPAPKPAGVTNSKAYWHCLCQCGNEIVTRTDYLRTGRSTSCGCWLHGPRIPDNGAAWNKLISKYKGEAKSRNLDWSLSREEAIRLFRGNCHYCNEPPKPGTVQRTYEISFNGIDRLDSENGYVPGNVVSCCKWCNYAKNTMTVEEFRAWLSRTYQHFVLKAAA